MSADGRATAVLAVLAGVSAELVAHRNGVPQEVLDGWAELLADEVVTISSPGRPIAPADVQRLFEPFQRGRTDGEGVGLGLFVGRSLTAAHGGQLGLRTSVDGNHFWLRLPVSPQTRSPVTTKDTCRAISTPWSAMRS